MEPVSLPEVQDRGNVPRGSGWRGDGDGQAEPHLPDTPRRFDLVGAHSAGDGRSVKRYLLFTWGDYEDKGGGFNDFHGSFDSVDAAKSSLEATPEGGEVVDRETWRVVAKVEERTPTDGDGTRPPWTNAPLSMWRKNVWVDCDEAIAQEAG